MSVAENKAVVQRLLDEVWNGRRFGVIDELYAADYVADSRPYGPLREDRQVVHQRGIVDNLAGHRQVGVMPTPPVGS